MSLAIMAIQHGLDSVEELVEISGVPRSTLNDWYHSKPKLMKVIILGCFLIKMWSKIEDVF